MGFWKQDSSAAMQTERAKLAAAQTKIADLERERAAKLPETDDLATIEEIDRQIAAQRHAVRIHTDRMAALAGRYRRIEADQREQKRTAAVALIEKKLARRNAIADELKKSTERTAELYVQLMNAAVVPADFPFSVPSHFGWSTVDSIGQGILHLLHRLTRNARGGGIFVRDYYTLLNTRSGARNIAADVAADSERLLAGLRAVPLPEPVTDDETSEAA